MALLEMGGADDQGCLAGGRPEGVAARGTLAGGFDVLAPGFDGVVAGFDVPAEFFVWGVPDEVGVRGEDVEDDEGDAVEVVGDSDGAGEGAGAGGAGMPIAGASA
ncbi:hypothetical protein [Streptomyces sp. NPDC091371]|uniref:hypothetical protein n=1 Tax=Streptomyces sp. NPDC091371 TaxID=3155303 RepID=UPI00343781C6